MPQLSSNRDVTDAHLVQLAATHGLKLATLDQTLCRRPWSASLSENPLS
jgi:predicted nucleic acid-binding protein